jgi:hypothetical protein
MTSHPSAFPFQVGFLLSTSLLCACGPDSRQPGPHPNEVLFARLRSVEVHTQFCGDAPELAELRREDVFDEGDYLIFQITEDRSAGLWLRCTLKEASSCVRHEEDPSFSVSAHVMSFERMSVSPIENGEGCELEVEERWELTDRGRSMEGRLTRRHSLVSAPGPCFWLEEGYRGAGTNGHGADQCTVIFSLVASVD